MSEISTVKRLDGEIINNFFKKSLQEIIEVNNLNFRLSNLGQSFSKNRSLVKIITFLIELRLFMRRKYPFSKTLSGYELTKSGILMFHNQFTKIIDNFKYFFLRTIENSIFDEIEILPLWFQKIGRIIRLVLNINSISGSDKISLTDYAFGNKTIIIQNDLTFNDRIFASRQELFSLIYVKIIFLLYYLYTFI